MNNTVDVAGRGNLHSRDTFNISCIRHCSFHDPAYGIQLCRCHTIAHTSTIDRQEKRGGIVLYYAAPHGGRE